MKKDQMNKDKIIVLRDQSNNLYTLSPELIAQAKVNSKEHKDLVQSLVKEEGAKISQIGNFEILGTFERSQNKNIDPKNIKNMLKEGPGAGMGGSDNP